MLVTLYVVAVMKCALQQPSSPVPVGELWCFEMIMIRGGSSIGRQVTRADRPTTDMCTIEVIAKDMLTCCGLTCAAVADQTVRALAHQTGAQEVGDISGRVREHQ